MLKFMFPLLFCCLFFSPSVPSQDVEIGLLKDLRSDNVYLNAEQASMIIRRYLDEQRWQNNTEPLLQALKEGLGAKDYQFRHYCTWILCEFYLDKNTHIPESKWPSKIFDNLVEGLRDDTFSARNCFSNSSYFLDILYNLKERRPVKPLHALLKGDDRQARFAAAILLSNYLQGSVQPEVSKELYAHLKDDGLFKNEYAACQAFLQLGEKNFQSFFKQQKVTDWQQAAYVRFLTSLYTIRWEPEPRYIDKWVERLCDSNYQEDAKICVAALYLTPDYKKYFHNQTIPFRLNKLSELSQNLHSSKAKAKWVSSWYWFLRLDQQDTWYKPPYAAGWTLLYFGGF